jgi:hypothetical protein
MNVKKNSSEDTYVDFTLRGAGFWEDRWEDEEWVTEKGLQAWDGYIDFSESIDETE